MNRTVLITHLLLGCSLFAGCDSGGQTPKAQGNTLAAPVDVCGLITQQQVDSLFGESAGPGRADSPVPAIQGCVWPREGAPRFIAQVLPAPKNLQSSISMGEGYRVSDVPGLSGEAAVAIQQAKPQIGLNEGVAIFAIVKGDRMLTLSPVMLGIAPESPEFELLKQAADAAAQRL